MTTTIILVRTQRQNYDDNTKAYVSHRGHEEEISETCRALQQAAFIDATTTRQSRIGLVTSNHGRSFRPPARHPSGNDEEASATSSLAYIAYAALAHPAGHDFRRLPIRIPRVSTRAAQPWNASSTGAFGVLPQPHIQSGPEVSTNDVTEAGASCCRMS